MSNPTAPEDTYEALYRDLIEIVGTRLDNILDLLGIVTEREITTYLQDRVQSGARLWASQLLGDDDRLAAQTVIDLVGVVFPDSEPIPDSWWGTPLGRATARSYGHPTADAVSFSVAGAMLGVTKATVQDLIDRRKLERHPDGGVTTASVSMRLRGREH